MRLRPRQGLLLGIAVLAAGSVVLEIALARTLAALLGQHLAFAALTLALAGAGLGGVVLGALPGLVRRPALLARMSLLAGLAAAGTLAAILVVVHVKVPDAFDRAALGPGATVYLTAALPFFFVGLAVAAAVRHVPVLGGPIVFALFAGASMGAPLAVGAVRLGAPRAALVVVGVYAVASLLFYLGARGADARVERPRGAMVATFLLAASVLLAGDVGAPWLKLPSQRFSGLEKTEAQEWSVLGLASVDRATGGINWIHTDGTWSVPIHDGKSAIPPAPDEMAYQLDRDGAGARPAQRLEDQGQPAQAAGAVAVLGGGGGREARVALKYGHKQIDAVDLDPVVLRAFMLDRYKKTSGDVYDNSLVRVVFDEGRGFVRRAPGPYRHIVLAWPDTQAAHAAGALAAERDDLYTVESFVDLLAHLTPDGTLTATRLEAEVDRLVILAAAALRQSGAAHPEQHLYACASGRTASVVARPTPLAPTETTILRSFCRRNKLNEVFAPDLPNGEVRRRLTPDLTGLVPAVEDPAAAKLKAAPAAVDPNGRVAPAVSPRDWDLRAPTGDRPFFAAVVPPALWTRVLGDKGAATTAQGLLALAGLLAVAGLLLFFSVGLPLAARPSWPVGRAGSLLFFTATGASLGFAVLGLLPRMVVILGHPIYGYTTAVPTLMASLAIGGLTAGRVRTGLDRAAGGRAELLAILLALAAVALAPAVDLAVGLSFGARFAAVVVFLLPLGVLSGALLALGIRQVGALSAPVVPWCWGMSGTAAFAAAVLAVLASLALGYSAAVLAAGVCALVAAVSVPRLRR